MNSWKLLPIKISIEWSCLSYFKYKMLWSTMWMVLRLGCSACCFCSPHEHPIPPFRRLLYTLYMFWVVLWTLFSLSLSLSIYIYKFVFLPINKIWTPHPIASSACPQVRFPLVPFNIFFLCLKKRNKTKQNLTLNHQMVSKDPYLMFCKELIFVW